MKSTTFKDLLKLLTNTDLKNLNIYTEDELKIFASSFCRKELEEIEAYVVNKVYDLPGIKLKVSAQEEKYILEKVTDKFKLLRENDEFSNYIGLKKEKIIRNEKAVTIIEKPITCLNVSEIILAKLSKNKINNISDLLNLSISQIDVILDHHKKDIKCLSDAIIDQALFNNDSKLIKSQLKDKSKTTNIAMNKQQLSLFELGNDSPEINKDKLTKILQIIETKKKIKISDIMIELPAGYIEAKKYINYLVENNYLEKEENNRFYVKTNNEKGKYNDTL